ncbi:MAG TPA: GIY-YIG nuclease family protein [Bacteroidales bacterium]|nr:GIY-YIG nuclease family protein [Bacteroidales bacterium]
MYYVYVIKSRIDGRLYKGLTEDPERRLKEHNSGKTKSTRPYKPWKIIFTEEFENLKKARIREKYLKSGIGREFLKSIMDP